jgi:hypothetical protein
MQRSNKTLGQLPATLGWLAIERSEPPVVVVRSEIPAGRGLLTPPDHCASAVHRPKAHARESL